MSSQENLKQISSFEDLQNDFANSPDKEKNHDKHTKKPSFKGDLDVFASFLKKEIGVDLDSDKNQALIKALTDYRALLKDVFPFDSEKHDNVISFSSGRSVHFLQEKMENYGKRIAQVLADETKTTELEKKSEKKEIKPLHLEAEKEITEKQKEKLFQELKGRFHRNLDRHPRLQWDEVEAKLREIAPEKLKALQKMEETGGEPDVIVFETNDWAFVDCAIWGPRGRTDLYYNQSGADSAQRRSPYKNSKGNVVDWANQIGVEILDEVEYGFLQKMIKCDFENYIWIKTPEEMIQKEVALCGTRDKEGVKIRERYLNHTDNQTSVRVILRI